MAGFYREPQAPDSKRLWLFTTKAEHCYWDVSYLDGDGLVFGSEGGGVPQWLHDQLADKRVTIPHANTQMRSLNLATSVGIGAFEAIRQISQAQRTEQLFTPRILCENEAFNCFANVGANALVFLCQEEPDKPIFKRSLGFLIK